MKCLVLVVDDDANLRNGLMALVKMNGHTAISAASVREAFAQLRHSPSHLLLDMNLSDGEGTTILRHVRTENLPMKVAIISGSSNKTLMAEARSLNPDKMFKKPPDWDTVIRWISC